MDISNLTRKKIEELLEKGKRLDGRNIFDFRDLEIEKNISINAESSVKVKLGETIVLVGAKFELSKPYPDSLDEGVMITTAELSPLASENFELGPPRINAIELARIVDRGIRESEFINWKKLCLKEGESVWTILLDIYPLNDSGNLIDAAAIGAVIALKDAVLPKIKEKEDGGFEVDFKAEFSKNKLPLSHNIPVTLTFRKIGDKIILDPTILEEEASSARLSLALTLNDKQESVINALQKGGAEPLSKEDLDFILDSADKESKKLRKLIEKFLK
ncbi:RNA-binding protein [Candidatus Pacearchaeota archaeon CG_4_10_14_0_2_um_filter_31_10]|nr:MAG: RNA-binding protein [Candidatus Pacearchaeota archaeon CG10_big_fil_rev_8_21_14_0_10_31_59]PIZ80737.1 MAG: RNA-binding protein [Candidatus Pacearchaeota archaeon CG_4_10_14_0_2_um_filter_31_10]